MIRTRGVLAVAFSTTLLIPAVASAATLTVGPGKMYATPCAAIGAASAGDTVLVSPGTAAYTDSCAIGVPGLTVRGVDGRPKVDLSGTIPVPNEKGIYDITADDVTLDNLELTGASVGDSAAGLGANGAGIRDEASGLVVLNCFVHDNQDGILATPSSSGSTLTVEYTELDHNALGDGCSSPGCTHNIYVGSSNMETLVFAFNWSHDAGDGNAAGSGHLLKTRAQNNYILYNALLGETGTESYELDIPQGGLSVVVGNVIEKSPNAENPILLSYAEEGLSNTSGDLYVVNNTFVSDDTATSVTFIKAAAGTLMAHNNLFSGMGAASTTGALSADNLSPSNPLFAAPSTYDYHLLAGSPAIGQGVSAGSAGSFSLTPVYEYVQPVESVLRKVGSSLDVGAFQYGTALAGAGQSASLAPSDAGVVSCDDASVPAGDGGLGSGSGASSGPGSGTGSGASRGSESGSSSTRRASTDAGRQDAGSSSPASGSGCGCTVTGAPSTPRLPYLAFGLAVTGALALRRRRERASLRG